jgi:hypothetical protein
MYLFWVGTNIADYESIDVIRKKENSDYFIWIWG